MNIGSAQTTQIYIVIRNGRATYLCDFLRKEVAIWFRAGQGRAGIVYVPYRPTSSPG